MNSNKFLGRFALGVYLVIFFGYLLGPLVVMGLTAFNSSSFPSVSPWACFTYEWFDVLFHDERILRGIKNSFIIGIGTVILSVSIGLAASLVLTQVWPRFRSTYYTIIIAPILIPGVVLGISTLVFWNRVGQFFGVDDGSAIDTLFHNGIFLTIIGQSTFIASYCMLVFVARLQRFDTGLTEAALDLGASHTQAFRKILLPFMRPAIASAAVLAFLASFENYNTTTFTFAQNPTLTIELSQMVRYGINPSISALAFIIVAFTVFGALIVETIRRDRAKKQEIKDGKAPAKSGGILPGFMRGNVAAVLLVLLSFVAIAMVYTSQAYNPETCKVEYQETKQAEIRVQIEALQQARRERDAQEALKGPDIFGNDRTVIPEATTEEPAASPFGSVFDPGNLEDASGTNEQAPASPFGSVFDPGNLEDASGTND